MKILKICIFFSVLLSAPILRGQVVIPKKMLNDQMPLSLTASSDNSVIVATYNGQSDHSRSLRKIDATGKEVWEFKQLSQTANHSVAGISKHILARNGDILVCGGNNLYHPDQQDGNYPNFFRIDPCGNLIWSKSIIVDTVANGFEDIYECSNGNLILTTTSYFTSTTCMLYLFDSKGKLLKQHPSPIDNARFSESNDSNYIYVIGSRWITDPNDLSTQGRFGGICKLNKNSFQIEWVFPTKFGEGFFGGHNYNAFDNHNTKQVLVHGYSYYGNIIRDGIFIFTADSGKFVKNTPYTPSDSNTNVNGSFAKISSNKFLAVSVVTASFSAIEGFLEFRLIDSVGKMLKLKKTTYLVRDNHIIKVTDNSYMLSFSWITGGANGMEAAMMRVDSNLNILKWPTQDTTAKDPLCTNGHPAYIEFAADSADTITVVNELTAWTYWPHIGISPILTNSNLLTLYPNPATNTINIFFPSQSTYKAEVISIEGKTLITENLTGSSLNISPLSAGFYFLRITPTNGNPLLARFVKQ